MGMMNSLRHYSLGEPLSPSPHTVVASLPKMEDVRGYEEGDTRVLEAMRTGYPRFVLHPFVRELTDLFMEQVGLFNRFAVLVSSLGSAQDLLLHVGSGVISAAMDDELQLVHCNADDCVLKGKIQKYVQHTGCGISSRQAEDLLVRFGRLSEPFKEEFFEGDVVTAVTGQLAELYGCDETDLWLCASGMSAFYSGFRAVQKVQQSRGRTHWIQLGWLYLDSGCVLKAFLRDGETLECYYDVSDTDAFLKRLSSLSETLAAVVVECPTNPLVQICDLKSVSEAVHANGGMLIVDPTVASVYNMDVLPYADVLVNSLTKYAAYEGDVMMGSLALNRQLSYYKYLRRAVPRLHVPPYFRDLRRIAHEMQDSAKIVEEMNENALRLAEFLRNHRAVCSVYHAATATHYAQVARGASSCGAMISIELSGSLEQFYDKIAVMKGPSFGTRVTLLSPYMYLAHYDLVTETKGCEFLRKAGIAPELIRISVGAEPYDEIEAVFANALDAL